MFGFNKRDLSPRVMGELYVPIWADCADFLATAVTQLLAEDGTVSNRQIQDSRFEAFAFSVAGTMISLAFGIEDKKWKWQEQSVALYFDSLERALISQYSWVGLPHEAISFSTHGESSLNQRLRVYNEMFSKTLENVEGPIPLSPGFRHLNNMKFGDQAALAILVQLFFALAYLSRRYPTLKLETQLMFIHSPPGGHNASLFVSRFEAVLRKVHEAFAGATMVAKSL